MLNWIKNKIDDIGCWFENSPEVRYAWIAFWVNLVGIVFCESVVRFLLWISQ